jgi:hypothetical protein
MPLAVAMVAVVEVQPTLLQTVVNMAVLEASLEAGEVVEVLVSSGPRLLTLVAQAELEPSGFGRTDERTSSKKPSRAIRAGRSEG